MKVLVSISKESGLATNIVLKATMIFYYFIILFFLLSLAVKIKKMTEIEIALIMGYFVSIILIYTNPIFLALRNYDNYMIFFLTSTNIFIQIYVNAVTFKIQFNVI